MTCTRPAPWILAIVLAAPALLLAGQAATGQGAPASLQQVQGVEPIRCWRQATAGAVTIGESFRVTMTCAVFESADTQVVPDESRLNVASIQMAPFEIVGGTHPPDVRSGQRRFLQYEYEIRIISRDAIGRDVNVPALTISYRVHSRVGAAARLEGRDLSYVLPALPIRVLSLVPADATDIRDGGEASLASVDALRSRSRLFEMAAIALGVLALAMTVFALVPVARRSGAKGQPDRNRVPDRAVLRRAAASLREAQGRAVHEGWSDDRIADALAAVRVVSAMAIGHPISRKPLPAAAAVPEDRLRVDHGVVRRVTETVSSGITPIELDGSTGVDSLRSALSVMTAALYRRGNDRDGAAIDDAVRQAAAAADDIAAQRNWWKSLWARR